MGLFSKLVSFAGKPPARGPASLAANKNRITCQRYSVKGRNPETGRRKTVTVVAGSQDPLALVQDRSGLLPPYEVEVVAPQPPSDPQVQYALKLGFVFPADATSADATVFLSRAEAGEALVQPAAPDWMVRYVVGKGIYVPAYGGSGEVSAAYLFGCSKREKAAFFCMRVFCTVCRKSYRLLEDAAPDEIALFYEFADAYGEDSDFARSLDHYWVADLPLDQCIAPKRLKAYDLAAAFLKVKGARP